MNITLPRISHIHRQIGLLACGQALLLTNGATMVALNVLAGLSIAADPSLASLPVTTYVLGSALSTLPASMAMRRIGRRAGFVVSAGFCMAGSLLCTLAMFMHSLTLLCAGTMLVGVYNAFGQYYRFAAADVTDLHAPRFKERAISLVLTGGIVGGILGPEFAKLTKDLLPATFAGAYAMLLVYALLTLFVVAKLDIPAPTVADRAATQRPLAVIARQPAFLLAVLAASVSYGVMNLLMTATPLAMQVCGFDFGDTAFVLQWHIVGMFAPGLFTGSLIKRFGILPIMLTGTLLLMVCAAIAMDGISLPHFWWSLTLLGVGWNFMFVGATSLLTQTYLPAEKAKVQGINEVLIFLTMISSSFSAGAMFSSTGWNLINLYALPVLGVLALLIMTLVWQRRATMA